jgi:hypothetical protein
MSVLTPARFGLARMGATRFGYPILAGVRVPLYALFGVARLGATRLNYHSSFVFATINGVHYATGRPGTAKILNETLSIAYALNESPDTARCTTTGFEPVEGSEIIITLGSKNNLVRDFAGRILSRRAYFVGTVGNYRHDLNLIDYTWDLNRIKVRKRYTSTTVAVIAADLIATYAPGFTVSVAADIGAQAIDEITFTEQNLAACLTQLTKRVEGDWLADYHQVVKLFYEDLSETNPTILNAVHTTLDKESFAVTWDLSQILTRVYVEGGGVNAAASIAIGETILPLFGDVAWYEATGGVVVCGPQRCTYTGKYAGGGGGLVGTGAAPSGAPVLALASGAGLVDGIRDYAVTFVTPAGESVESPHATITSGLTPAPTTALTAAAPTIGTGPDPGSHDYAVTFVTASGETTPGPSVTRATDVTPAPVAFPIPGTPTVGTGPDDGSPHLRDGRRRDHAGRRERGGDHGTAARARQRSERHGDRRHRAGHRIARLRGEFCHERRGNDAGPEHDDSYRADDGAGERARIARDADDRHRAGPRQSRLRGHVCDGHRGNDRGAAVDESHRPDPGAGERADVGRGHGGDWA